MQSLRSSRTKCVRNCLLCGDALSDVRTHKGEASATSEGFDRFHTSTQEKPCGLPSNNNQSHHETAALATGSVTYVSKCSSAPTPLQLASGSVACGRNPGKVFGPYHSLLGSLISPAVADTWGRVSGWRPCSILCPERLALTTNAS